MIRSNRLKIAFDAALLALLAAVYCANPTGLSFHEWAGLGIYLLFIAHVAYNRKWLAAAGKRLFSASLGARVKALYAVDLALLAAFFLIGLSGVMISHKIFKLGVMAVWRPMHSIASAVSVLLIGVHIGLHGALIARVIAGKGARAACAVVCAALLAGGVYGAVAAKTQTPPGARAKYETVIGLFERSAALLSGPPEYVRARQAGGGGGAPEGGGKPGAGEAAGRPSAPFNPAVLAVSVSSYLSFILAVAALTAALDRLRVRRAGKQEQRACPARAGAV